MVMELTETATFCPSSQIKPSVSPTQISQYVLSWKSSTRIVKSSSKVNGPYGHQTHNPGVISTMLQPAELMLDPDLILTKEATVISIICGGQCHLATKWTISACKSPYFPISWFALFPFPSYPVPHHFLMSSPPFWYI